MRVTQHDIDAACRADSDSATPMLLRSCLLLLWEIVKREGRHDDAWARAFGIDMAEPGT